MVVESGECCVLLAIVQLDVFVRSREGLRTGCFDLSACLHREPADLVTVGVREAEVAVLVLTKRGKINGGV